MFVLPVSLLLPRLIDRSSSKLIRATKRRDAPLRTSARGYVILSKSNIRYYQVTIFSNGGVAHSLPSPPPGLGSLRAMLGLAGTVCSEATMENRLARDVGSVLQESRSLSSTSTVVHRCFEEKYMYSTKTRGRSEGEASAAVRAGLRASAGSKA